MSSFSISLYTVVSCSMFFYYQDIGVGVGFYSACKLHINTLFFQVEGFINVQDFSPIQSDLDLYSLAKSRMLKWQNMPHYAQTCSAVYTQDIRLIYQDTINKQYSTLPYGIHGQEQFQVLQEQAVFLNQPLHSCDSKYFQYVQEYQHPIVKQTQFAQRKHNTYLLFQCHAFPSN